MSSRLDCGCGVVVARNLPKVDVGVRFPSPAQFESRRRHTHGSLRRRDLHEKCTRRVAAIKEPGPANQHGDVVPTSRLQLSCRKRPRPTVERERFDRPIDHRLAAPDVAAYLFHLIAGHEVETNRRQCTNKRERRCRGRSIGAHSATSATLAVAAFPRNGDRRSGDRESHLRTRQRTRRQHNQSDDRDQPQPMRHHPMVAPAVLLFPAPHEGGALE